MGNEGKKRIRKSPQERKAEIIAAAGRLIGEKGYYGTSLKDIADAIGMSRPGLLHYIGNKERLLSLLVTDNYDQQGTPADFAESGLPGSDSDGMLFPYLMTVRYKSQRGRWRIHGPLRGRPHSVRRRILRRISHDEGH